MRKILISGYGGGETASIAEYRASDDWSGLTEIWRDNIEAPSFLSSCGDMCFAMTEKEKEAALFCYRKTPEGYVETDRLAFEGGALCHIYYSPRHRTLYGACYLTGHVIAAAVENYKFAGVLNHFVIKPDEEGGLTRAHCCVPDRDEDRLFVCNIALDRVYVYNIEKGSLFTNKAFPHLQLERGEGPRHLTFHPRLDMAYVITEYSNKVFVMAYNKITGALSVLQEVSTLPEGFGGRSFCSGLVFSDDGRYLYAANRGANTVCVFEAGERGLLRKLGNYDCGGNWPRHIELTADGRFLMVANQESNDVAIIPVSEKDGLLKEKIRTIPFNKPGCAIEVK